MQHTMSPSPLQSRTRLLARVFPPQAFSLRHKLWLTCTGLVLILTLGLLFIVESRQQASIVGELKERGVTIATHVAAVSIPDFLTYNFITLQQHAAQTAQGRDVLYTIILDRDGRVAAYSGL